MLTCVVMRISAATVALVALVATSCGSDSQPDHQAEWLDVLRHKPAALASEASPEQKQLYADSLRAFVQKHPAHTRSQEVWLALQLEFAGDLASAGRHQDAIRFYRAVLALHPENEEARSGLATSAGRLAVTREKLLELEKGMSHRDVAEILGRPMPGWTARNRGTDSTFEAWYYRTRSGGVAGVYFRDGEVFAAEEDSSSRLGS